MNIYYSLIFSHIVYAIQVWGSANETELNKILTLQKKAVRMMTNNDIFPAVPGPLISSEPLFKELQILRIDDVFKFFVSKFIYTCERMNVPSIFQDWFRPIHTIHHYNTTSNTVVNMLNYFEIDSVSTTNNLHTEYSRLANYGSKLLKVQGPKIWNSLPLKIRQSESIFIFKKLLKRYFVDLYDSN